MVTGRLISPLDVTALPVCEPCLEGKMTLGLSRPKVIEPKRYWIWYTLIFAGLCPPVQEEGTSTSSPSLMVTQV